MKKKCFVCGNNQAFFFREDRFTYFKCGKCNQVSTYPLPSAKEVYIHYKKNYSSGNYMLLKKYSTSYLRNYELMAKKLEKLILEENKSLNKLKVLDIGCFTGDFLEILQKKGLDVFGIELQKEAARIAENKFKKKIITKDVADLDNEIKDESLDCITMLGLIEHVRDPKRTLDKASRLLKSGGVIMIQTPNTLSLPAIITGKLWPPYTPVEHIFLFSDKSLKIELEKLGFENFRKIRHFKTMPFSYLYQILGTFGPDWKRFLQPLYSVLPSFLKEAPLPFYIGEYIYFARKK